MIEEIINDTEKLFFIILSLAIFADWMVVLFFFNKTRNFIANAKMVRAKITKLEPAMYEGKPYEKASLSFEDHLGQSINTTINVQAKKYAENDEIDVLSHKDTPADVKFNSFQDLWLVPSTMFFGSMLLFCVLLLLVSQGIAEIPF